MYLSSSIVACSCMDLTPRRLPGQLDRFTTNPSDRCMGPALDLFVARLFSSTRIAHHTY